MAVNLSPYGGVGAQFLDNSGNVLTGGKIYTYAAGTTTNQPTYTTSAGNVPHSNPIILDASGRVPSGGEIWLTDGLSYKFILRDANDVLIATYDNVTGINSNFIAFTNQQEIQTATAGQTVFNFTTMSYQPATNSLSVFVDGVNQYGPGAQYAYVETDSDTVTFVNGLHVGAEVKFTTSQLNSNASQSDAFQVSYTPPFTGSVGTNVGNKLAQTVSVKDFGAVGDGVADDTAAIQAARDYMVAQTTPVTIIFPAGIYKYSVSPNWANYDVSIQAEGMVRLRYTGTDNAVIIDGGATITSRYNVSFLGNFCVEATSAAKNGYFVRAIQHSKIEGRVDGCGTTYAGLRVEFCVCTEFSVRTTINQIGAWYAGAQPANGIYVTNRGDPLEQTTACTFINPIIEGVSGDGIVLDHASNNTIIGGTSEGNTGLGILATANSTSNLIQSVDFETNTAGDIEDYGFNNTYFKINSISSVTLASDNAKFLNSTLNSVVDNGLATSFVSTTYNTLGTGTLTGTAAQQSLYNLRNGFVGYFEQNKTYDSVVNPSVTLPHNTATTVLTINVTGINGNRYYQVTVYKVGLGTAYAAYALVYRDGSTCYIVSQTNGANLTLTVSGLNILATQNSGSPITGFFAKASAI
jgi:hypothetical protein